MSNASRADGVSPTELDELRSQVAVLKEAQTAFQSVERQCADLVSRLRAEAARRERTEEANRYSAAIETLLASISTRFVNVSGEQLDALIERSLAESGRFLGVDRSYLLLFSDDGRQFSNVAEWCALGVTAEIDKLQHVPVDALPWITGRLQRGELVAFGQLDELPPEAKAERAEFQREGVRSLVNVPVSCGGLVVGVVGFDAVRAARRWTSEESRILQILAELVGAAIGRRRAEAALRDSEERFRRAFDEGPVGMSLVGVDGLCLQVNRVYAAMLGYRSGELVGQPLTVAIHADDRYRLEPLAHRLLRGELSRFHLELRFVHKDGRTVWGRITGTAIRDLQGKVLYGLGIVEDVSERKVAEEEANREQQLLRRLLDLHERERKMIAYEIHDGLAQQLTGALFTFQALGQLSHQLPPESQTLLTSGVQMLTEGIAETRRLISGLRPPILDESGVVVALEFLVGDMEKRTGVTIDFSSDVRVRRLAAPLENTLFRMAQETLTNATRYSHSPKVAVRLHQCDSRIVFEIQDWGIGFDPDKVGDDHFGLKGLRERARLLGGMAEIHSAPNQGTQIHVELPLIEAREEET
jgi:PAS domain S-box-containing protein